MSVLGTYFGDTAGKAISGGINSLISGAIGYHYGTKMADYNYKLNEQAANNADARRRALYRDFESPAATIRQLKEAGLSPSLYAEGALGSSIGSTVGAQGGGGAGASMPNYSFETPNLLEAKRTEAEIKLANAQARNANAEADVKEIEKDIKNIDFNLYQIDYNILAGYITDKSGNSKSFYEIAAQSKSYNDFLKTLREGGAGSMIESEQAQKTLRDMYKSSRVLERDIATLGSETTNANFQKQITLKLASSEFAKLNADAAVQALKTDIATNELDESQKDAWNSIINYLEENHPTMAKIAVILGMIVNRFAGKANMKVNIGKQ